MWCCVHVISNPVLLRFRMTQSKDIQDTGRNKKIFPRIRDTYKSCLPQSSAGNKNNKDHRHTLLEQTRRKMGFLKKSLKAVFEDKKPTALKADVRMISGCEGTTLEALKSSFVRGLSLT